MRWVIATGAAAALCLGGVFLVKKHLESQQQDIAKPMVYPKPVLKELPRATDLARPQGIDSQADYSKYVQDLVPALSDKDPQINGAALDVLMSLPPSALPAVESASKQKDLSKPAQAAFDRLLPLLQFRAKKQQREDQANATLLKAALADYDRYGHHTDPKIDAAAHDVIRAYFEMGPPRSSPRSQQLKVADAFETLIYTARCDDPLVRYFYVCLGYKYCADPPSTNDRTQELAQAIKLMSASNYPPFWKALVRFEPAPQLPMATMQSKGAARIGQPLFAGDATADQIQALFSSELLLPEQKLAWARAYFEAPAYAIMFGEIPPPQLDQRPGFEQVYSLLEKALPDHIEPTLLKGGYHLGSALNVTAYSLRSPTEQELKTAGRDIQTAAEAFEKAYAMDPTDPRAATRMIDLIGFNPLASGQELQQWFARAMQADPDNYEACLIFADFVESPSELKAFGAWCRATHNYRARLPLGLAAAHCRACLRQGGSWKYFENEDVWNDIRSVYEQYLVLFPDDRAERTAYASLAAIGKHWRDAHRQCEILGDNAWPDVFEPMALTYTKVRKEAAANASLPAAPQQ